MSIRSKLLILLLAISLGPLFVAVWYARTAATSLGETVVQQTRERLIASAKSTLQQTISDHGRLLKSKSALLQQNLRLQAQEARALLNQPPPADRTPLFLEDQPEDVLSTSRPATRASLSRILFYLPPGVERAAVADDAARLAGLLPSYQAIHQSQAELILWQYTCLENGLFCFYPGAGRFPESYEPRMRYWYRDAIDAGGPTWSAPSVDASSGKIVLTMSMPIAGPDNRPLGVTAIDVLTTDLVSAVELPAPWGQRAQVKLVVPFDVHNDGILWPVIIAERNERPVQMDWNSPLPLEERILSFGDAAATQRLATGMAGEKRGIEVLEVDGSESLWAFGPLPGMGASLVAILPYEDVIGGAAELERSIRERILAQRTLVAALIAAVVIAVLVLSLIAARHWTRPIDELAQAAQRIAAGDLDTPVHIRTGDELSRLGDTVNAMLPQLRERIRIKQSLSVAMEVQQSLLPKSPPQMAGLDIAGRSIYCDETGGDYFDFVELAQLGPHALGVAVGDVTGHGVAAALLMATARAHLRSRTDGPHDLGALLSHMNAHLAADVPVGRFMTLMYLLFDTAAGTMRWASAGHDPAIVYNARNGGFHELRGIGIPLGIEADWEYREFGPEPLAPGQVIVIGTDGIWEARNRKDEMFGKERLRTLIAENGERSAEEITVAITRAITDFRAGRVQDDDVTLVVVRVQARG